MVSERGSFTTNGDGRLFGHLSLETVNVEVEGNTILCELSLNVSPGEIVGLLGRDGAGKTTCFETIAGFNSVNSGHIFLNGFDVTSCPADCRARLGLAYLPEMPSVFRGLTTEENILAVLEIVESEADVRSARLSRLLADFELELVRNQPVTTLSGGERRRCEVARAMALNPTILLLDEPFKGLDPTSVASTKRLIENLKGRTVGVLVSDYDLHDLIGVLDRVYVLDKGQVIFDGSPYDLLNDAVVRSIFLGEGFQL